MPILSPGLASRRPIRSSRLMLGWRASDIQVAPYTGQPAAFQSLAGSGGPGTILGITNQAITAGRQQPRWINDTDGITRLAMQGDSSAVDEEHLLVQGTFPVANCSWLIRVLSLYTKGSSVPGTNGRAVYTQGTSPTIGAGVFSITREGVYWRATRRRGVTGLISQVTEPGTITYPVDVLATLTSAGVLQVQTRDAANVLATGTTVTDANMAVSGEIYAAAALGSSSVPDTPGGLWRLEQVKVARGIQTFATFDLLG